MAHNNLAVLTHSHKAIAAKKKVKREQIKEILFDDDARRDFLTGFHKRKLAKADAARKKAQEREKEERLEARREQRQILRERALENAAQVEKAYAAMLGVPSDDWDGISSENDQPQAEERDEAYENEETLATVTVVEDFDPDSILHGPTPAYPKPDASPPESKPSKPTPTPALPKFTKKKPRDKKIRYQSNDERKVERTKQRARRTEKAELAGGKASKKSTHGSRRRKGASKR